MLKKVEHPKDADCNKCGKEIFRNGYEMNIWVLLQERFNSEYYCTGCYMEFKKHFEKVRERFFNLRQSIFKKPAYITLGRIEKDKNGNQVDMRSLENSHHDAYFRLYNWHCIRAYKKWVKTFKS